MKAVLAIVSLLMACLIVFVLRGPHQGMGIAIEEPNRKQASSSETLDTSTERWVNGFNTAVDGDDMDSSGGNVVVYRARELEKKQPFLHGSVAAQFHDLYPRAKAGDGFAAYHLSRMLVACERNEPFMEGYHDLDCSAVTKEMMDLRADLFTTAARHGVVQAQISHFPFVANIKFPDFESLITSTDEFLAVKRESWRYLENAAQQGYIDALVQISMHYRLGQLVDRDIVSSYAYLSAAYQTGAMSSAEVTRNNLTAMEGEMSDNQLFAARRRSAEILNWCCR